MKNEAYKVSIITIVINIGLCLFKLIAGVIGNSQSMISDAIHSGSDVLSTIIVLIGIKLSKKESDKEHPYGHEKFESLSAVILGIILLLTGISLGISGIKNIWSKPTIVTPSLIALIAAVLSIAIKEWMYHYTVKVGKKLNSDALIADAWHHRSDAISSIGSLVGISLSMVGFVFGDVLASIVISIFIGASAINILKESVNRIIDSSADDLTIEKITNILKEEKEIRNIDSLKTRLFGSKIYVDLEISLDKQLTLEKSHDIAEKIHLKIEDNIDNCKHCMVHVNPYNN